jgi:hypothetical protein
MTGFSLWKDAERDGGIRASLPEFLLALDGDRDREVVAVWIEALFAIQGYRWSREIEREVARSEPAQRLR